MNLEKAISNRNLYLQSQNNFQKVILTILSDGVTTKIVHSRNLLGLSANRYLLKKILANSQSASSFRFCMKFVQINFILTVSERLQRVDWIKKMTKRVSLN